MRTLDRYVLRQFFRIFGVCVLGVPFLFIVIKFTDDIDNLLADAVTRGDVFLHYAYQFPYHMLLAFPIACLIGAVFTVSSMTRHLEVTAAKAGGISFLRLTVPMLIASFGLSLVALALTEVIPAANEKSAEVLGEEHEGGARLSFVYRGDGGRYYTIRRLTSSRGEIEQIRIDREGSGYDYPPYSVDAATARWDSASAHWVLRDGTLRLLPERGRTVSFEFDELHQAAFTETPDDLLAPPKDVENMDYGELEAYIDALDRSGSDTRQLRVELMLKIAFPFACFIIALFGAPLANSSRRGGASISIGIALVTTLLFLSLIRIAEGLGAGGILPPPAAAWLPNAFFLAAGVFFYRRVAT
ncbi:MAG: LptF/LptG family permease [Gemmatimonadales bacterium]|jgi:lipopolysaccharide export system permease protein